jgi:hypothetical protein
MKQWIDIIQNYVNGNLTEFKKEIRALKKIELLELVEFWAEEYGGYSHSEIIYLLINRLR